VFDEELLEALPSSRAPQRVAALLPGVTTQRQDVGGIQGDGTGRGLVTVRGVSDARMNINGVSNQATSQSVTPVCGGTSKPAAIPIGSVVAASASKTFTVEAGTRAPFKTEDFRVKSADELNTQLANLKKEQFNLRFQRANGQVENTGRIRVLRRDIARIQTVLTEQRRAAQAKG